MKFLILILCLLIPTLAFATNSIEDREAALLEKLTTAKESDRASLYTQLARIYSRSNFQKSLDYASQAIALLEKYPDSRLAASAYYRAGYASMNLGQKERSEVLIKTAIGHAKNMGNPIFLSDIMDVLLFFYVKNEQFDKAKTVGEEILQIRIKANDEKRIGQAYMNLGIIEQTQNNHPVAAANYFKSLRIFEKINHQRGIAKCYSNIAKLKESLREHEGALEFYHKALATMLLAGPNELSLVFSYLGVSTAYLNTQQPEKAIEYANKGLAHIGERNYPKGSALLYGASGKAHIALSKYNEAYQLLQKAERIAKTDKVDLNNEAIYSNLAKVLLKLNRPDEAEKYIQLTLKSNKLIDFETYSLFSDIYTELGKLQLALDFLKKSRDLQVTHIGEENTRINLDLDKRYQNDKLKQERDNLALAGEKQRLQRNAIVIGGLLFISILFLVFRMRTAHLKTTVLEEKVRERTKELSDKQNTISHLLDKKNELFANVSHEFRTPLTLILGPLKNLLHSDLSRATKNTLTGINTNAKRLLKLVDQLLTLARIDAALAPDSQVLALSQSARRIAAYFEPLANEKNIDFQIDIEDKLYLQGNADAVEQIVSNLLSNAIKYTPNNETILFCLKEDGDNISLQVTNTGAVIPQEQHETIFERFSRLEQHRASKIQGTGIGLALVKEWVKTLGGNISLSSTAEEGTTFLVKLPRLENVPAQEELVESVAELEWQDKELLLSTAADNKEEQTKPLADLFDSENDDQMNKPIALIAEDNIELRQFLSNELSQQFLCIEAVDGDEATKLAQKHLPDIIISDVMMPKKDGFELAAAIRNNELTSHIPLILLTAKSDADSRISGFKQGIDDYIAKPFDMEELLVRINNLLSVRKLLKRRYSLESNQSQSVPSLAGKKENSELRFIDKLNSVLEQHYGNAQLDVEELANLVSVSRSQLYRKLRATIDLTPLDFLREYRLQRATELLVNEIQIGVVADRCGFKSAAYFSTCFSARFGVSPKQYQTANSK